MSARWRQFRLPSPRYIGEIGVPRGRKWVPISQPTLQAKLKVKSPSHHCLSLYMHKDGTFFPCMFPGAFVEGWEKIVVFLQEVKCTPCSQLALQIRLKSQCSFQGSPSGNITSSKGFHNLFSPYSQNGVFSNSSAGMLGGVSPCCCMFLPSILLHAPLFLQNFHWKQLSNFPLETSLLSFSSVILP